MTQELIVEARGLSKAYNIYDSPRDIVKELFLGGTRHDVFWALRNIDLSVYEGQRVGLIGPNGAGKSTLLKIISGHLTPTSGSIEVRGRVSAMLTLTSFLRPDESGLENIKVNLLLTGTPRKRIPELVEEIVDFTELGAFIHAPVRTYSSGMSARLSFGISTAITPDILIVDEVLGAGDAYFAAKAQQRMIELCRQGRALLLVSHAMNVIQLLCDTAVWIDQGGVREIGRVDEVARHYEEDSRRQEDESVRSGNQLRRERSATQVLPEEVLGADLVRLRLIGAGGKLADTHYVRSMRFEGRETRTDVSLDIQDLAAENVSAALDLTASEWGRFHTRRGTTTRTLMQSSRLLRGGHLLVRRTALAGSPDVIIESEAVNDSEDLRVEVADLRSGDWIPLDLKSDERRGGWRVQRFALGDMTLAPRDATSGFERILASARPDIEIVQTKLSRNGDSSLVFREREPFEVRVTIRANASVPLCDVALKIVRVDGFYVFWQSSGQVGENIPSFTGERDVVYDNDPNASGAGDYELTVEVGNGFDVERNFPYSEIYDRRVNAVKFTVEREWKILMLGPVNYRFPVRVEHRAEKLEAAAHQ